MSSTLTPPKAAPASPQPQPPAASPAPGLGDLWRAVNRFLTSKYTAIGLILAMAVFALIGTLLVQVPDEFKDDPETYASWLESIRPKYRGWTGPLDTLGFFDVFSSLWFQVVTVTLAISIIACTVHRVPLLWRNAQHPHLHVRDSFFDHAGLQATLNLPGTPEDVHEQVRGALKARHYRTIPDPHVEGRHLYADRFRWAPFGTALAHASFVIILLGVMVTGMTGFNDTQFVATIGIPKAVGHDTGLTVEALSFTDTYDADGRPMDYNSEIVVSRDGQELARKVIRVNEPLNVDGISFHQSFFGTSAIVKAVDGSGASLFDGGVPLQWTSQDEQAVFGRIDLPDRGIQVFTITPASGVRHPQVGPGQLLIEAYRTGEERPYISQLLDQGKPAEIDGVTYTFVREQQYTGLSVSRDIGALWVWIGSALMVIGLCLTLLLRHRRLWVHIDPGPAGSRVRIASAERHDATFASWFSRFVTDLSQTGARATTPKGK